MIVGFRGRRGSVLLYVLITSLIVGMIAAYLMRMVLDRYGSVQRQADSTSGRLSNESALAVLISNPLQPCKPPPASQPPYCTSSNPTTLPAGQASCTLKCLNPNPSNSASQYVTITITPNPNIKVPVTVTP